MCGWMMQQDVFGGKALGGRPTPYKHRRAPQDKKEQYGISVRSKKHGNMVW